MFFIKGLSISIHYLKLRHYTCSRCFDQHDIHDWQLHRPHLQYYKWSYYTVTTRAMCDAIVGWLICNKWKGEMSYHNNNNNTYYLCRALQVNLVGCKLMHWIVIIKNIQCEIVMRNHCINRLKANKWANLPLTTDPIKCVHDKIEQMTTKTIFGTN